MANGRQIAEQNFQRFTTWEAEKTISDFKQMVVRGVLSRKEIAKECGFSKSALDQNPRIKQALKQLEDGLREKGVLPAFAQANMQKADVELPISRLSKTQRIDSERMRRLEQENACMKEENLELKRQLARLRLLKEALSVSGRIPR